MKIATVFGLLLYAGCAADSAPTAPECTPDTCPDFYDDEEPEASCAVDAGRDASNEKHGAQGAFTTHTAQASLVGGDVPDNCQPWSYLACWRRPYPPVEYGATYAATCPSGRTCTLRDVAWSFGWDGLTLWQPLPANTVQICVDWFTCLDVSNSNQSIFGGTRYGQNAISGFAWTGQHTFSIWGQVRDGVTKYNPRIAIRFVTYQDGV